MNKNKFIAAFLNFLIPGLGTAYAGNMRNGRMLYFLFLALVLGWRFIPYNYVLFLLCFTIIIAFWIYLPISGYKDVPKNMVSPAEPFRKGYYYGITIY